MTYITQLIGRKAIFSSRLLTMLLTGFVLVLLQSNAVQAQWTTGTDISNTNSGNVGIGVSSPGAKLDVQRNDGSDLLVRAQNSSTTSGAAIFRAAAASNGNEAARLELTDNAGYNGGVSADHNNGLIFKTGNQSSTYSAMGTRMTITTAGNVGIGTTAPATNLHVATESTAVPRGVTNSQHSGDGNAALFTFRKSRGTIASPAAAINGDNIGNLYAEGYDGASYT